MPTIYAKYANNLSYPTLTTFSTKAQVGLLLRHGDPTIPCKTTKLFRHVTTTAIKAQLISVLMGCALRGLLDRCSYLIIIRPSHTRRQVQRGRFNISNDTSFCHVRGSNALLHLGTRWGRNTRSFRPWCTGRPSTSMTKGQKMFIVLCLYCLYQFGPLHRCLQKFLVTT